jgi:hypothetical protein
MPSPRQRTKELIERLDADGVEYLRLLIAEISTRQDKAAALTDASAAVVLKPANPG